MVGIERRRSYDLHDHQDSPPQQLLNRLNKQFEDLSIEDRRVRVAEEIDRMDLSETDRQEVLRRLE